MWTIIKNMLVSMITYRSTSREKYNSYLVTRYTRYLYTIQFLAYTPVPRSHLISRSREREITLS